MKTNTIIRKRVVYVIIGIVLVGLIFFRSKWGYEKFDVEDVTQPTVFLYDANSDKNNTVIRVKIKAELKGQADVEVYPCSKNTFDHAKSNTLLSFRIKGNCDTLLSHDYYTNQACISYKPRKVNDGNVSISVLIN